MAGFFVTCYRQSGKQYQLPGSIDQRPQHFSQSKGASCFQGHLRWAAIRWDCARGSRTSSLEPESPRGTAAPAVPGTQTVAGTGGVGDQLHPVGRPAADERPWLALPHSPPQRAGHGGFRHAQQCGFLEVVLSLGACRDRRAGTAQ